MTSDADQLIVSALATTGTLAVLKKVTAGEAPDVVRVLVGVFVGGTMLTLLAQGVPQLAKALAVLILIASLIYAGADVFNAIARTTRGAGYIAPGQTSAKETNAGAGVRVK